MPINIEHVFDIVVSFSIGFTLGTMTRIIVEEVFRK